MRANEPVYRDEVNALWGVAGHADVQAVERRSDVFVSGRGYRSWWSPEENNMIAQDDPGHLEQRRQVSDRFTPRSVREHRDWIVETVEDLLSPIERNGELEVVEELAAPLPCRLTARLLGFSEDRWPDIKAWSESLIRIDAAPHDAQVAMDLFAAIGDFALLLGQESRAGQGCPVDGAPDLLSVWVNAELDGSVRIRSGPTGARDRAVHRRWSGDDPHRDRPRHPGSGRSPRAVEPDRRSDPRRSRPRSRS